MSGVLSGISLKHLANISSPTFAECQSDCRSLRLLGPDGDFFFEFSQGPEDPFSEPPKLSLSFASVREFHLVHRGPGKAASPLEPLVFHPSFLPSIEAFSVNCEANASCLLSELFSDPFSCPSLRTLASSDCDIPEGSVKELGQFALNRMATSTARLGRVVIVNSKGKSREAALGTPHTAGPGRTSGHDRGSQQMSSNRSCSCLCGAAPNQTSRRLAGVTTTNIIRDNPHDLYHRYTSLQAMFGGRKLGSGYYGCNYGYTVWVKYRMEFFDN